MHVHHSTKTEGKQALACAHFVECRPFKKKKKDGRTSQISRDNEGWSPYLRSKLRLAQPFQRQKHFFRLTGSPNSKWRKGKPGKQMQAISRSLEISVLKMCPSRKLKTVPFSRPRKTWDRESVPCIISSTIRIFTQWAHFVPKDAFKLASSENDLSAACGRVPSDD